jgi:hypothetical protein
MFSAVRADFWHALAAEGLLTGEAVTAAQSRVRNGEAVDVAILGAAESGAFDADARRRLRALLAASVDLQPDDEGRLGRANAASMSKLPPDWMDRPTLVCVGADARTLEIVCTVEAVHALPELALRTGRVIDPYIALTDEVDTARGRVRPAAKTFADELPTPAPLGRGGLGVGGSWASTPLPIPASSATAVQRPAFAPLSKLGTLSGDWVPGALDRLEPVSEVSALAAALADLSIPGLDGWALLDAQRASEERWSLLAQAGGPHTDVAPRVLLEPRSTLVQAFERSATQCGPFQADSGFEPLLDHLGWPTPVEVYLAPVKRSGANAPFAHFVGYKGKGTIAPIVASAIRRWLVGLAERWPPSRPRVTAPISTLPPPPAAAPDLPSPAPRTLQGMPIFALFDRVQTGSVLGGDRPSGERVHDTQVDLTPLSLADLAMQVEVSMPTATHAQVAPADPAAGVPLPRLLDLDHMQTAPAVHRLRRPSEAPVSLPPTTQMPAVSADRSTDLHESEAALPALDPGSAQQGWTHEHPLPVVTAVRSLRPEAETALDEPALRSAMFSPSPTPRSRIVTAPALPEAPESVPVEPTPPRVERRAAPNEMPLVGPNQRRRTSGSLPVTEVQFGRAVQDLALLDVELRAGAETLLLAAGEAAVDALVAAFPGHLTVDRFAQPAGTQPFERHSGLLHAFARFGPLAILRLPALCRHLSPEIRYYAVYAFTTLRSPRSLDLVVDRVHDSDASVREIALFTLESYRDSALYEGAIERLRAGLLEGTGRQRKTSIEAVARLRVAEAIPDLAALLDDATLALHDASHRALVEVTRADLGHEAWKWLRWWEKNRARPRMEWLLDGLLNEQRPVRAGAFQELRRATYQNYGYLVDAPPMERRAAWERWMKWWREHGRAQYTTYR